MKGHRISLLLRMHPSEQRNVSNQFPGLLHLQFLLACSKRSKTGGAEGLGTRLGNQTNNTCNGTDVCSSHSSTVSHSFITQS